MLIYVYTYTCIYIYIYIHIHTYMYAEVTTMIIASGKDKGGPSQGGFLHNVLFS